MMPSFSFVLPAYKASYLYEAISSILNQTYTEFELIIVNDASPYNLDQIVNRFDDSRIRYYENSENLGKKCLTNSWNHALKYAKSDYIILASDDDCYNPDYLLTMYNLSKKYPSADLFHCRLKYIDADGHFLFFSQPASEFEKSCDFISQRLIYNRKQAAPEFMFRRTAIERIEGFIAFPLAWYSDDATWNALSLNGVAYSSQPLVSFRLSGENISTSSINVEGKIDALYQYKKWLGTFLEKLSPNEAEEQKLLDMCRTRYESILNSHIFIYLPQLSNKVLWKYAIQALQKRIINRYSFFRIIITCYMRWRS